MFPHTPKLSKKPLISFRLRAKRQNCRGYVPSYERTPKNERYDIHSVFATHVETVCLLSKGDVKSQKLRVEFSLEDMDTDGFKKGATYNAIRDWIKEKYGYRVTNLNIAQVKQKHGNIERENYNKPKSLDSKQPGCPEEKIKAIDDTMGHFQMI